MTIDTSLALQLMQMLCGAFFSVLFIQSGLDKLTDFKGNLEWLNGHFSKTFLRDWVAFLLGALTLLEISCGLTCASGLVLLLLGQGKVVLFWGVVLCAHTLVFLFGGQRIAKDYAGAAGIVPYFVAAFLAIYVLSMN